MKNIALLILLLPAHAFATSGVNVRDFGAKGDGITDDRSAIQQALDAGAGHEVFFPVGTYLLSPDPGNLWCLRASAGTELRGEDRAGTKLIMAPQQPASIPLIRVENAPD